MKRLLLMAGALLLLGGGLRAQEDSLEKIQKDLRSLFADARKSGQIDPARMAGLVDRTMDFATDHKGADEAFEAYTFVLQILGYLDEEKRVEVFGETMDALVESFVNSPRMAEIAFGPLREIGGDLAAKAGEYVDSIGRESTNPSVKCACAFARTARELGAEPSKKERDAAVAAYKGLQKSYGELDAPFQQGKWKDVLQGEIDELTRFAIGAMAPDIVGKDLDGVEFKLSDYRGKVVLLDFWGYW